MSNFYLSNSIISIYFSKYFHNQISICQIGFLWFKFCNILIKFSLDFSIFGIQFVSSNNSPIFINIVFQLISPFLLLKSSPSHIGFEKYPARWCLLFGLAGAKSLLPICWSGNGSASKVYQRGDCWEKCEELFSPAKYLLPRSRRNDIGEGRPCLELRFLDGELLWKKLVL